MPANNATTESGGFSAAERAAMKKRAAELRAEGKKGANKADALQAVLDSIAEMAHRKHHASRSLTAICFRPRQSLLGSSDITCGHRVE